MIEGRKQLRKALLVLIALSFLACPLASSSLLTTGYAQGSQPFGTVPPQQATIDAVFTGTPAPTPAIGTVDGSGINPQDLEHYVLIGSTVYPIGDEFLDASGIPLGPVTEDYLGWYGYATIADRPDLRLIWITDAGGVKHYMIAEVTSNLFAGNPGVEPGDGFEDYLRQMNDAEDLMIVSLGGYGAGLATAVLTQYLACAPTAGAGCVTGTITGILGAVGGIAAFLYHGLFKLLPAERNVLRQFDLIDQSSP